MKGPRVFEIACRKSKFLLSRGGSGNGGSGERPHDSSVSVYPHSKRRTARPPTLAVDSG